MPIKLAIFDWDGTLVDSAAKIVECFDAASREVELSAVPVQSLRRVIGLSLDVAIDALWPEADPLQRVELMERYRVHFLKCDRTAMPLFPGVASYLPALHAEGCALAVSTGKSRRGLQQSLLETGLADLFSATRCADEAPSKPHPRMILDILGETGIDADDAIMIGDTVFDLQMAKQAEVKALAVTYGAHDAGDLQACAPDVCVNSFKEVYEWIRNHLGS